jgi:hypothetical protein
MEENREEKERMVGLGAFGVGFGGAIARTKAVFFPFYTMMMMNLTFRCKLWPSSNLGPMSAGEEINSKVSSISPTRLNGRFRLGKVEIQRLYMHLSGRPQRTGS